MKNSFSRKALFGYVVCLLIVTSGCHINIGSNTPKEKYERIVTLSKALASGRRFEGKICNGSITVSGADVDQCDITATLITRGKTVEEAQELSPKIVLRLEETVDGLAFRIDKPAFVKDNWINVKLDVTIPIQTNLVLDAVNGRVDVRAIDGDLKASTVNGSITSRGIFGKVKISTVNGRIECNEITGDVRLSSVNGSIKAVYSEDSTTAKNVDISTTNGSIDLEVPDDLSAKVDASVLNGSIDSSIPITVKGKIGKRNLKGTMGTGQGLLKLRTLNGSIKIK